jgi:hypothetical protein
MRVIRCFVLGAALLALTPASARADGYLTPFLGYNFGGDSANCQSLTNCDEKHSNYGLTIGSASGILGFEEDIAYAKDFFAAVPGTENNVFSAMSNMLVGVFAGPVQPYGLVGIGLIRSHVSLNPTNVSSSTTNAIGYDIGGGVYGFFSPHVGIRGDVRHLHTFQDVGVLQSLSNGALASPQQKLDYWRASLGVAFKF